MTFKDLKPGDRFIYTDAAKDEGGATSYIKLHDDVIPTGVAEIFLKSQSSQTLEVKPLRCVSVISGRCFNIRDENRVTRIN